MSRGVHLVGSVPLGNAHEVFTVVSRELGQHLRRIPDGETGERSDWITWLEPIFAGHEAFEPSGETFQLPAGVVVGRPLRKTTQAVQHLRVGNGQR